MHSLGDHPVGLHYVRGKTDRRKVVSVLGPSGRTYSGIVCCSTLPPAHRVRLSFIWVVEQGWFDSAALLVIIANSIVLAVQGPPNGPDSPIPEELSPSIELTFTILFTIEALIKITAMGFVCHRACGRRAQDACALTFRTARHHCFCRCPTMPRRRLVPF